MIAIPNMEKPKDCKECQWHLDFYIEDEQVGGLCTITEKDDKENTCPLIEIDEPKVGRGQRHGHWRKDENGETVCSRCDYPAEFNPISSDFIESNYCPNCGAKMERRADEHTD